MSNDALESSLFLKLDGSNTKMIEALQTHLALEYEFFETPADIVESAIFEMYTRIIMCEVPNYKQSVRQTIVKYKKQNEQRHFNVPHSVLL